MFLTSDINEQIAKEFLTDSKDFLIRYNILKECSIAGHQGLRSKLLVDLLFSAECSIKALVFLTLREDVNAIYKKICTHTLQSLLDILPDKEKMECEKFLNTDFISFSIENRYLVEVYKTFHSNGALDEHYYDTIANPAWFDSVSDKLEELHNYVWKKVKVPIEGGLLSEIDIDKIEEEHKIKMGLSKKKRISK